MAKRDVEYMCLLNNLYDYILSISHSKLDIILNIEKFGLGAILLDKLKVLDNNLYIQWKVKEIIQNSINKIIQNELIALSDACDNANIKLIHLKGLTLAEDLYKPREARIFNDIDVLVRPEEISKVLQILLNMGYTYKIGNNLADNLTDLKNLINNLDLDTEHHISELTKQIGNFNISLELHYNLRSEMGLNICIDDIIDRSTRKSFFGRPIWILDLHDQLIFLMIHFAYHYSRLLSSVPLKKVHPACEIRRIHDIALLIKKYADYINWDIIGKRAIEWNAAGPVLCSLQLLQHIYKIFI